MTQPEIDDLKQDVREIKTDIKELIKLTASYKAEIIIHRGLLFLMFSAVCGLVWRIAVA